CRSSLVSARSGKTTAIGPIDAYFTNDLLCNLPVGFSLVAAHVQHALAFCGELLPETPKSSPTKPYCLKDPSLCI
ncbi:MAG: hypothetical protein VX189_01265, partial [Planctomycetota bacterium]|nr:hypothetical protein [Planctomycetota bacterium]